MQEGLVSGASTPPELQREALHALGQQGNIGCTFLALQPRYDLIVRALANAGDTLIDRLAGRALLLHGGDDACAHGADLTHPGIDVLQCLVCLAGLDDAVFRLFATALHDILSLIHI